MKTRRRCETTGASIKSKRRKRLEAASYDNDNSDDDDNNYEARATLLPLPLLELGVYYISPSCLNLEYASFIATTNELATRRLLWRPTTSYFDVAQRSGFIIIITLSSNKVDLSRLNAKRRLKRTNENLTEDR